MKLVNVSNFSIEPGGLANFCFSDEQSNVMVLAYLELCFTKNVRAVPVKFAHLYVNLTFLIPHLKLIKWKASGNQVL